MNSFLLYLPRFTGSLSKVESIFKIHLLTYRALSGLALEDLRDSLIPQGPSRTLQSQNADLLVIPKVSKMMVGGRALC